MRAYKSLLIGGMCALMVSVLLPAAVAGGDEEKEIRSGPGAGVARIVTVPSNEVINRDYFAFGDVVEISGTVKGDVYAAARTILIDGTIEGDLLAAAGSLVIAGRVGQDARIAAGRVTLTGTIAGNLTVAGGDIDLVRTAAISGGLVAAAWNMVVSSPVRRDAKIASERVTVSNQIDGNLHVAAGSIRLTSNASVGGDLMVWSGEAPLIDPKAQVKGTVIHRSLPDFHTPSREKLLGALAALLLFLKVMNFVSTLILGLLLVYIFPGYQQTLAATLGTRPWASLGIGFAFLILAPFLIVILAATLVGLPLALIFLAMYCITLYLARIVVIVWAGTALAGLFKSALHPAWGLVIGLILYSLITLIPLIGGLVALFVTLFGLGAFVLAKKEVYLSARKSRIL